MFFIKTLIDNLNINYFKKGSGKATLIIPGWGTTINLYITLINSVSKYSCVYCLDMPGFGESDEPNNSWNVDNYVSFIIKFLKNQKITEVNLIGHSNGGRIIIKLMSSPEFNIKVNKIILIGSVGIVRKKSMKVRLKIKFFKFCKKIFNLKLFNSLFPNLLSKLKNSFGSEDYKSASPVMKETLVKLVNEDLKEYLHNINVPTLLIWGELDTETPLSNAKLMEKLIPNSGLVTVKNCSHYVFIEEPAYVNKIIYTFLNGVNL